MIIGISGKAGSGKDTVGKIIEYLTAKYSTEDIVKIFNNKEVITDYKLLPFSDETSWQIKKFAKKLKQIVSILTGIPEEDLEKQEVKDRVLGEEWWYWKIYSYVTQNKFVVIPYKGENKGHLLVKPTVREKMIEIADDIRAKNPNAFANALFMDYQPIAGATISLELNNLGQQTQPPKYPNWIITDVRFPNDEADPILERGGILIRVNRFNVSGSAGQILNSTYGWVDCNPHYSEIALDNYPKFTETITNNGSIEELTQKVKTVLQKHKII